MSTGRRRDHGQRLGLADDEAAAEALAEFGVPYEVGVVSAHRTPQQMLDYADDARPTAACKVIIAGAGGAAHLPGMVASVTPLPVIGVPVPLKYLDGMDSLLSIVQMPAGVPVATVSIGGARNAGLLAVRILAPPTRRCARGWRPSRPSLEQLVAEKDAALRASLSADHAARAGCSRPALVRDRQRRQLTSVRLRQRRTGRRRRDRVRLSACRPGRRGAVPGCGGGFSFVAPRKSRITPTGTRTSHGPTWTASASPRSR